MHFNNIKDNKRWTVYNAQQLSEKLNTDKIWYEDIKSIHNYAKNTWSYIQ